MKQTQSNKKQCIFQLPKLTSKQREIVFATEKLVAVSASPQTGKTWALVILALMTSMKI
jgi:ATP-dependent exoDNAse (exonuclease V) beta subunit